MKMAGRCSEKSLHMDEESTITYILTSVIPATNDTGSRAIRMTFIDDILVYAYS